MSARIGNSGLIASIPCKYCSFCTKRNCHHKPCSCEMQKEKCILARLGAAPSSFMLPLANFEFAMLQCFRGISKRLCRTQKVLGLWIRLLTAFQLPQLLIFTFTETCPWDWTSARGSSQSWPAYRCFVNRSKFEVYCKNPSCGGHEFRQCQHLRHGCLCRTPRSQISNQSRRQCSVNLVWSTTI